MSLPSEFPDPSTYFKFCIEFLDEFAWIYSSSNTKFIKDSVLNRFPADWREYFTTIDENDLNCFPDGLNSKSIVPESLENFQSKLITLKPSIPLTNLHINEVPLKRMSPKKSHEILKLSKLISETCTHDGTILIDFGSGLGYLSEILHKMKKFRILGLECDRERVELALKRQKELYPSSISDIVYREQRIIRNSAVSIQSEIQKAFPYCTDNQQAIVGLHACADLSITAIEIFLQSEQIRKLVIMPCCYHKLELSEDATNSRLFKNFPLSTCLTKVVENSTSGFEILNRPFLRLACQQTVARWRDMTAEDHTNHGNDMFIRGLVECLVQDETHLFKVKASCAGSECLNFQNVCSQYQLKSNKLKNIVEWTESSQNKFEELLTMYPNGSKLSEGLTCLQTGLQELCENIVLLDRICFTREYAEKENFKVTAEVKKILNDKLSPRCFALVAEKHIG